jgi:hypothetical protein
MLTDHDLLLLFTGAAIALVSAVITALMQHILSLREDRIRRERDERARNREHLTEIPPSLLKLMPGQDLMYPSPDGADITDTDLLDQQLQRQPPSRGFLGFISKVRKWFRRMIDR